MELQMVAARSKPADDLRPLATDMGIKDLAADLRQMMDAENCAVDKGTKKVSRALPASAACQLVIWMCGCFISWFHLKPSCVGLAAPFTLSGS